MAIEKALTLNERITGNKLKRKELQRYSDFLVAHYLKQARVKK